MRDAACFSVVMFYQRSTIKALDAAVKLSPMPVKGQISEEHFDTYVDETYGLPS